MRRTLALPVFRRLLAAYALNELGWWVGSLSLTVLVYRHTGSAIGAMVFFLCAQFVPALLAPPLVARIDQRSPGRVLPILYALEALLFGALAWVASRFSLPVLLALTVADGAVSTVARALSNATRVEVLKPVDLLHEGNVLVNVTFSLCYLGGPLVGGAVVASGGTIAALLANCVLFGGMAVLLATAGLSVSGSTDGRRSGRLRSGLAYARTDRGLLTLLGLHGIGLACFTLSIPVEIVFISRTLGDGATAYGALLSAAGGGAVAGSAIYARWRRGRPSTLIAASAAVTGVGFALITVAPSLELARIGALLGGIGNGVGSISMQTAIQERTPEAWMALIMSLNEAITNMAPGLGIVLGGVITSLTSPRVGLGTAAAGSLAFAVLASVALRSAGGTSQPDAPEAEAGGGEGTRPSAIAPWESLV